MLDGLRTVQRTVSWLRTILGEKEKYFRLKINYSEEKDTKFKTGVVIFKYGYDYTVSFVKFKTFWGYCIEFECRDKSLDFSLISDYMYDLVYCFGLRSDNEYWQYSTEKGCYFHNSPICGIDNSCIVNVMKGKGVLIWNTAKSFTMESYNYIDTKLVGFVNDLGVCKLVPLEI